MQGDSRGADGQWNFLLPGGRQIGYIRITGFAEAEQGEKGTAADFRAALEQLRKEKIRGLVLDLRGNPGGSLKSAVDICDMLVPKGEIVTTRGRDGQVLRAYSGFRQGRLHRLSDRGAGGRLAAPAPAKSWPPACRTTTARSSSASEATARARCRKWWTWARVGRMKLTIATYWRPSGQNINRPKEDAKNDVQDAAWGVSPNEGYDLPVEDAERERLLRWQQDHELAALSGGTGPAGDEVPDRVLLKAVEYLESKK